MYTKEFTIKSYETATSKCPTLSTPSLVSLFSPLGTASFEASQRFIDSRGLSARSIIILSPSLTWYRKWWALVESVDRRYFYLDCGAPLKPLVFHTSELRWMRFNLLGFTW